MIRITTDKAIEAAKAKAAEEERRRADIEERFMDLNCRINDLEDKLYKRIFDLECRVSTSDTVATNTPIAPVYPGWKQPCTTTTEPSSFCQVITPEGEPK